MHKNTTPDHVLTEMATGGQQSLLHAFCEAVKCSKCDNRYPETPQTLQCLHTFCRRCLAEHAATLQGKPLTCPECGVEQTFPLDDPANVETNVCFENLLRHAERELANPGARRCGRCTNRKRTPVEKFCTVCRKSLCNSCVEDHQAVPETQNHDLVANTGQHGRWFCSKHAAEGAEPCLTPVNMYCERCEVVMCMICRVTVHAEHPACTAVEAYRNQGHRDDIEKHSAAAKEVEDRFEETIGEFEKLKLRLLESKRNAESAIDRKVAALHEALEEEKICVKRAAKEIFDEKTNTCDNEIEKLAKIHANFQHSQNVTKRTLEIGKAEDVLFMEGILINGLKQLTEKHVNHDHKLYEDEVIHFTENSRANVKGLVGRVDKEYFIPGLEGDPVDTHYYARNL